VTIASDLAAIDANVNYNDEQKRILKGRVRALPLQAAVRAAGNTFQFNANGATYSITLETALAASFGFDSPVFVHPQGMLVLYVTIRKNGVLKFPLTPTAQPLMISNNPFTDSNGNENPLQAAKDILVGLVG
jgi:hypothetical protein